MRLKSKCRLKGAALFKSRNERQQVEEERQWREKMTSETHQKVMERRDQDRIWTPGLAVPGGGGGARGGGLRENEELFPLAPSQCP